MILTTFGSMNLTAAYAEDDTAETEVSPAYEVVISMGFMNKELLEKERLTRGEMAGIIAEFYEKKFSNMALTGSPYSDVKNNNKYYDAIMLLAGVKAVEVPKNGLFRPNDAVTSDEAAKLFVDIMQKGFAAEYNGGYPNGYRSIASVNKMTLFSSADGSLSGKAVAQTIYNILDMTVTELIDKEYKETKTVLEYYFDAYKTKGVITGTYFSQLGGVGYVGKNEVEIDYRVYGISDTSINDYIGYNTEFYYTEDDNEGPVLWAYILKNNKTLSVEAENAVSFDGSSFKYSEAGKDKSIRVVKNVNIFYNGEYRSKYDYGIFEADNYNTITFLDNNVDGKYETAFLEKADGVKVSGINTEDEKIYTEFSKNYNLSDINRYIILDENNNELSISDLKIGDMLSVYESDSVVKFIRPNKLVSGTVKAVSGSGYDEIISVGGEGIKLRKNCYTEQELKVGANVDVYKDMKGYALVILTAKRKSGENFGYLIKTWADENEDSVGVKLLNDEGNILRLRFSDKVKVDGDSGVRKENVLLRLTDGNGNIINRVVIYTLNNDGNIIKLDTPAVGENEGKDTLHIQQAKGKLKCRKNSRTFMGLVNFDSSTVIMNVPKDNLEEAPEKCFGIYSADSFVNDDYYTIESYVFDSDEPIAKVMVVFNDDNNSETSIKTDSGAYVLEKVVQMVNADGEVVYNFKGQYRGGNFNLNTDSDFTGAEKFMPGDVVVIEKNNAGEIRRMRKVFDVETMKLVEADGTTEAANPSGEYSSKNRWAFGNVYCVSDNVMRLEASYGDLPSNPVIGQNITVENHYLPLFNVVKFNREMNTLTKISYNEIPNYLSNGEASKAFVSTLWGDGQLIVIYE